MLIAATAIALGSTATVAQSPAVAGGSPLPSMAAGASPSAPSVPIAPADPDLEARLPHTVGGQPLAIESHMGAAIFTGVDQTALQPLVDGLAAQGKTMADLSIAVGHNEDYSVAITAVRVPGADAGALIASILQMAPAEEQIVQTQATIAGKAMTTVTDSTGAQQFYAVGDTLWIIRAVEPALSEIIAGLH